MGKSFNIIKIIYKNLIK